MAQEIATPTRPVNRIYTVNQRLLVVSLIVVLAITLIGYFWYQYRLDKTATAFLTRAEQLEQEGNWDEATSYYQRYLLVEPDNTDVLVRLVHAYSQGEPNPNRLLRLNSLLYRVLGRAPERDDLRQMLAENLIKIGSLEQAELEAQQLLDGSPEIVRSARKLIAMSQVLRANVDRSISIPEALQQLLEAADESPEDVELISLTASSLRTYPASLPSEQGDPATRADDLMNQLVTANPENIQAHMARYQYRKRFSLPGASEDIEATLQLNPDHVDGLLASALTKLADTNSEENLEEADTQLRQVIELAPEDSRGYLALASLLQEQGEIEAAKNLLQGGMRAATNNFEIGLALSALQLQNNKLEQAEETLEQLKSESSIFLARLPMDVRKQFDNRLRLLSARIDLAQDQSAKAIAELTTIFLTEGSAGSARPSREWLESAQLLAAYYSGKGEWDQAVNYWESVLRVLHDQAQIVELTVQAVLRAGDAQRAVEHIDRYLRLAEPTDNLLVQQVQAHLQVQLQRPPSQRNWSEYQRVAESAENQVADRWELLFADVDSSLANGGNTPEIVDRIRGQEAGFEELPDFWRNAAIRYQLLNAEEDQQRALSKYRELTEDSVEPVLFESLLLVRDNKSQEALVLLEKVAENLPLSDRLPLDRRRLEILAATGDMDRAFQAAEQLIAQHPEDTKLLALGSEIALTADLPVQSKAWEERLGEATRHGYNYQYLKIRRLLLDYDNLTADERQRLKQLVATLRAERPRWFPIVALAAQHAELAGDTRRAVGDYQLAVDLGDRRPYTLQQLVTLLYDFGRMAEAEQYLEFLASDPAAESFVDAMNVEIAVSQNRSDATLQLARDSVAKFPKDPRRRLLLANLLLQKGELEETEAVLRKAIKELPNNSQIWTGMVTYFVQSNQTEKARELLENLAKSDTFNVKERHYLAAQCWEQLGDTENASKQYQLALEQDATNPQVHLRYARLLSRSDPRAAQGEYEQVLKLDAQNDEARRELAVLLASTGEPADWERATQLLESTEVTATGNANTNDRLRAMLLAQQGRTRSERIDNCRAASRILEKQISRETGEDADLSRLLLVQILEQEATLSKDVEPIKLAHENYRAVLDTGTPSAERIADYIEFLLRQARKSQEALSSDSPVHEASSHEASSDDGEKTDSFAESLLMEAESRLADLRLLQQEGNAGFETLDVALTAQIMQVDGNEAEAHDLVDQYVAAQSQKDSPNSLQQFISFGRLYTLLGDHKAAEMWYRRVMDVNPKAYVLVVQSLLEQEKHSEAAQVCIDLSSDRMSPEVATTLANIMTSMEPTAGEDFAEAEKELQKALQESQENVNLLQAEAVRKASLGNYEEAISVFTRIVQLDPENALALNNLATLLAEKPNRQAEALELIQRAIDHVGRKASLLDTQGTIYLKLGQAEQAIASLEEATAGGIADARYYLHLAAAYHLAAREEDARAMLIEAKGFGLENFLLTEDDRQMLEDLNQALHTSTAKLGV